MSSETKLSKSQSMSWVEIDKSTTIISSNISLEISPIITGYWEVYTEQEILPYPLNKVPEYVNNICIAFVAPQKLNKNDKLATIWGFDVTNVYSKEQIKIWINDINKRNNNQGVYFSLLDTPNTHWFPDVDIDKFCLNISNAVYEYGLAGIDIDAESGMTDKYIETFVLLIKTLKKYIPDKKILYTCYTESEYDHNIINQCKNEINLINTMAYWDDFNGMKSLYNHYVNDIGNKNKVGIGVKAGNENIDNSTTKLSVVDQTSQWTKQDGHPIMMLWSLTRDIKDITNKENNTYLNTIYNNFNNKNNIYNNNCIIL